VLLNLFLALFLADAVITFLDDLLTLLFGTHLLTGLSAIMFFLTFLSGSVVYLLIGITPLVPKRFFLPLALFLPLSILLTIPFLIYFYGPTQRSGLVISSAQVLLGLVIVIRLQRGSKFQGALVKENHLGHPGFSWLNLLGFGFVNCFVLLPLLVTYLFLCSSLVVHHFSEGFIELRPSGISVQVRKYVRDDGRTVELVPMSHIGETSFYRSLSQSFPTNALILMEGVTDEQQLLTNKISYQRMAKSLGLAEQQREFKPSHMHLVRADVDISEFRKSTIAFLNLVMLVHARGIKPENLMQLMTYSAPPEFQEQLFDDLLIKRNQHVVGELKKRLSDWDHLILPWGAAHMPGISHEVQKLGFHVAERKEYQAVTFHFFGRKRKTDAGRVAGAS
jgi:hypothetical protein